MIRLFVGIDLPSEIRASLSALAIGLPGAHWVPEENLHLTLRFVGEVSEGEAHDLHDALVGIRAPSFTLTIAGLVFSRPAGGRTLYGPASPNVIL